MKISNISMKIFTIFIISQALILPFASAQISQTEHALIEELIFGKFVEDKLSPQKQNIFYEILIEAPVPHQDLVIVVKGKTPVDDPEVRIAFTLEDLERGANKENYYSCESLGREVCLIPSNDLINKWNTLKNDTLLVYVEVFCRDGAICQYLIQADYSSNLYASFGNKLNIQIDGNMARSIVLDIEDLNDANSQEEVIISVLPSKIGLIEDKIEFYGYLQEPKNGIVPDFHGIEIWNQGMGMRVSRVSKAKKVYLKLIATSNISFEMFSWSNKKDYNLRLEEKINGLLREGDWQLFKVDLSSIVNYQQIDLVLMVRPYSGVAKIEIFCDTKPAFNSLPQFNFLIYSQQTVELEASDRQRVCKLSKIYYLRISGIEELSYSMRVYPSEQFSHKLNFEEATQGINLKGEITNYILNVSSSEEVKVVLLLFNIYGDSDLYVRQVDKTTNYYLITLQEIEEYQQELSKGPVALPNKKFILAKTGENKREFTNFVHSPNTDSEYIIAIVGASSEENRYVLRAAHDTGHVLLETDVPYKDTASKFHFHFYKYKSPNISTLEAVSFVLTSYTGSIVMRSSQTNMYPMRGDFQQTSDNSSQITYLKRDYQLVDSTFYISIQGLKSSIYTITPVLQKTNVSTMDSGVYLPVGFKQDFYLSNDLQKASFYIKIPFSQDKSLLSTLRYTAPQGEFQIMLDEVKDNILLEKGTFNSLEGVNSSIQIPKGTFSKETVLFGIIKSVSKIEVNENRKVSLFFSVGEKPLHLDINKAHKYIIQRKQLTSFVFEIEDLSQYNIQIDTFNSHRVEFYLSTDQQNTQPSNEKNNGVFQVDAGHLISTSDILSFCPFIKENKQTPSEELCKVYFSAYSVQDIIITISISTSGSFYHLHEGANLIVPAPSIGQFSYFNFNIEPQRIFVEVEVNSSLSKLQIYGLILSKKITLEKKLFPTSQTAKFSSKGNLFGKINLQIQIPEELDCWLVGCQLLLSIDCLSNQSRQNSDTMNVQVFTDKTIRELRLGYDFPLTLQNNKQFIQYLKIFVGQQDVKNLRIELFGDSLDSTIVKVTHQSEGLPIIEQNESHNSFILYKPHGSEFLQIGNYFIGILVPPTANRLSLRAIQNSEQVIYIDLHEGRHTEISIGQNEKAYFLIPMSIHLKKEDMFEFIVFDMQAKFYGQVYTNSIYPQISTISDISQSIREGIQVGNIDNKNHKLKMRKLQSTITWIIVLITSSAKQELKVQARTTNTVQKIPVRSTFYDILSAGESRIFDLCSEQTSLQIGIMGGEISISNLLPSFLVQKEKPSEGAELLAVLKYKSESGSSNFLNQIIKKNEIIDGTQKIFIENLSKGDSMYTIRNQLQSDQQPIETLYMYPPIFRKILPEEKHLFVFSNSFQKEQRVKLSMFVNSIDSKVQSFPTLTVTPKFDGQIVKIIEQAQVGKLISLDLSVSQGQFIAKVELNGKQEQEVNYMLSMDSSGINILIEGQQQYHSLEQSSNSQYFKLFQSSSSPIVLQLFDCLGENWINASQSLTTLEQDIYEKNSQIHQLPHQPYKTYIVKGTQEAELSLLYVGVVASKFEQESMKSSFILQAKPLNINSVEANYSPLLLPYDDLYLKERRVKCSTKKSAAGNEILKFQVQGIQCKSNCSHLRAKVVSILYELYIATSSQALQQYSVCRTNMTDYEDVSKSTFSNAFTNEQHQLFLRKALLIKQFDESSQKIEFEAGISEIKIKKPIYFRVVGTITLQNLYGKEVVNVPFYYNESVNNKNWWNYIETEEEQEIIPETNTEESMEKPQESESVWVVVLIVIGLVLILLILIHLLIKRLRTKDSFSIKNIFQSNQTSHQELNSYQSYN